MATIKGIKLLHKRYTIDQWINGTGLTAIPTLAFGEFGIATDTKEVRCNTNSTDAIKFTSATLVSFPDLSATDDDTDTGLGNLEYIRGIFFDNAADNENGASLTAVKGTLPELFLKKKENTNGDFITSLEYKGVEDEVNSGGEKTGKKLHVIEYGLGNAPTSTLTISTTHSGNESEEGKSIDVVTKIENISTGVDGNGSSDGHDHKIKYTTVAVPSLEYVEGIVDAVGIEVNTDGTGDYVSSITLANDKRTLTLHMASLPAAPKGSGEVVGSENKVVRSVSLDDHTLSGTTIELKGSENAEGGEITVTNNGDEKIIFGFKEGVYALKSEISMAMIFKGTLGTNGTTQSLPEASAATAGHSYKVITAGNYGTGDLGDCDIGDLIVCRQTDSDDGYEWIRIPAGDDVDDFVQSVDVGTGIVKSGTTLAPVLSHESYSSAAVGKTGGVLTPSDYGVTGKVITSIALDTDGLGHVTATPDTYEDTFVNIEGARKIAQEEESVTTVVGTGKIVVDDSAEDGSNDHSYIITHAGITKNDTTPDGGTLDHSDTFTAVTSVVYDNTGHVSGVATTTYKLPTDDNDYRPIQVDGEEILSAETQTALNFTVEASLPNNEGNNTIKAIELDTETVGTIKLKTLGKATSTNYGFVKLGNATQLTIDNTSKVYGVGMTSNGQLAVSVPWENTDMYSNDDGGKGHLDTDTGIADGELRFVAIKRDHAGHVMRAEDITTIDGNA